LTFKESYKLLAEELMQYFDPGEVQSIGRILYEDLFNKLGAEYSTQVMTSDQIEIFLDALSRLIKGEPIDYITGIREFFGRRFKVGPSVLIPRQETEELVTWIVEDLGVSEGKHIIDIGTGSGCIPISIDKETKTRHQIFGIDISEQALAIAQDNNRSLRANVRFDRYDILQDSLDPQLQFDVIVSNPPYILTSERALMNRQVLDHEPDLALYTDGNDPLVFYKRINQVALERLHNGGSLYYEISALHKDAMISLMVSDGFVNVECRKDMSGNWRMLKAKKN